MSGYGSSWVWMVIGFPKVFFNSAVTGQKDTYTFSLYLFALFTMWQLRKLAQQAFGYRHGEKDPYWHKRKIINRVMFRPFEKMHQKNWMLEVNCHWKILHQNLHHPRSPWGPACHLFVAFLVVVCDLCLVSRLVVCNNMGFQEPLSFLAEILEIRNKLKQCHLEKIVFQIFYDPGPN